MRASCGTTKNHVITCITASSTRVDHSTESGCINGPAREATAISDPIQNTIGFAKRRPSVNPESNAPIKAAISGSTKISTHESEVGVAPWDRLTSKETPHSNAIPKTMRHKSPDQIPVTKPAYSRKLTFGFRAFGGAIGVTERSHGREDMCPLCRIAAAFAGGGLPRM